MPRHEAAPSGGVHSGTADATRLLAPLGRLFLAGIFLASAPGHFTSKLVDYAAQAGVPLPGIAVPLAGAIALVGGLSVLVGYRAKLGAWLLVLFLVPVTLMMHRFWAEHDPMMVQMQMVNFMKNMAILGGVLLVAHFGPGPVSFD
jgi:putative oxidoreductase